VAEFRWFSRSRSLLFKKWRNSTKFHLFNDVEDSAWPRNSTQHQ